MIIIIMMLLMMIMLMLMMLMIVLLYFEVQDHWDRRSRGDPAVNHDIAYKV